MGAEDEQQRRCDVSRGEDSRVCSFHVPAVLLYEVRLHSFCHVHVHAAGAEVCQVRCDSGLIRKACEMMLHARCSRRVVGCCRKYMYYTLICASSWSRVQLRSGTRRTRYSGAEALCCLLCAVLWYNNNEKRARTKIELETTQWSIIGPQTIVAD